MLRQHSAEADRTYRVARLAMGMTATPLRAEQRRAAIEELRTLPGVRDNGVGLALAAPARPQFQDLETQLVVDLETDEAVLIQDVIKPVQHGRGNGGLPDHRHDHGISAAPCRRGDQRCGGHPVHHGQVIDPRRLRVLRALADHGTVTAAAAALHLTPSAVSQQLAALESEAGHTLLRRRGRRVSLTAAGRLLVTHAHAVAAELERAQATLDALDSGTAGRVALASFASAITQVVAPALAALRGRSIELSVRDAEGHESVRLLVDGEIDVAITEEYRSSERISRFPLYTEPFDVVLPPGHALSGPVDLAALADEDWVVTLPGNPLRDVVEMACAQAGFAPRITHTSDDFRAIEALVAAGAGVALAPRNAIAGVPVAGVAPLRRVVAAVRKGSEEHPLIQVVLEELRLAAS